MTLIHDIIYAPGTIFCQKQKEKKTRKCISHNLWQFEKYPQIILRARNNLDMG